MIVPKVVECFGLDGLLENITEQSIMFPSLRAFIYINTRLRRG